VPHPTPVDRLRTEYTELDLRQRSNLSADQRRSLIYFHYELDLNSRVPNPSPAPVRVVQWFAALNFLENFIAREGRWPRENNRAERDEISEEERRLAIWVRSQRSAIDHGRRCEYQIKRLACIQGFHHHPLQDRWNHHLHDFRRFTDTHHRAPSVRSTDVLEQKLAEWAAKQRFAYRDGTLSHSRIETLERLSYWTWGPKRTDL
jgi:hypothetical protein